MSQQLSQNLALLAYNNALPIAIFMATVIHVLLILSINFDQPNINKSSRTPITVLIEQAKKAQFIASNHQIGGDKKLDKPTPVAKKLSRISPPLKKRLPQPNPKPPNIAKQAIIDQVKVVEKTPKVLPSKKINLPKLSKQKLLDQVAQLGKKIQYQKPSSRQKRIKSIRSISANKFLIAQYITDWTTKIKKTSKLNYPAIANRPGFSGSLIMGVGINPDGSIYAMRISKSSGHPELDKVAERIVRVSSPFALLPKALLKEMDVLMIHVLWDFSVESNLSVR